MSLAMQFGLFIIGAALVCMLLLFILVVLGVAYDKAAQRDKDARPVGDDTITMLCPCCNGDGGDCSCTSACGNPRCQMTDPDEASRG